MRVTQEGMVQNTMLRLQERITRLDEAGRRLSSGKIVQVASDDVAGMNRVLSLRARIRAREQEARNASDGLTYLNIADSKLQGVNDRLIRARELMVRAGANNDVTGREALAKELETIRDDIRGLANSRVNGRPLFGGSSDAEPVSAGPPWVYNGNADIIERRISEQDRVGINVTGDNAFGFGAGTDVFTMLDGVIADVRSGNISSVSAKLADMDGAMTRIKQQMALVGAATNRVEVAMLRNGDEQNVLKAELAQVEDVDLAVAIMDMQTQEVAYQATLGALARVLQPSLVEFLR